MQEFAPRGWRAALAAEQQGLAHLKAAARQSAASLDRHAGRIAQRVIPSLQQAEPSGSALSERQLPCAMGREPDAACPAPADAAAAAAAAAPARTLAPQYWLLAVAAAALLAFIAGWLAGRWHLRRHRSRRKERVPEDVAVDTPEPAAMGIRGAAAAAASGSFVAAPEHAQQRAASLTADTAAAAGHPCTDISPSQSAEPLAAAPHSAASERTAAVAARQAGDAAADAAASVGQQGPVHKPSPALQSTAKALAAQDASCGSTEVSRPCRPCSELHGSADF